MACAARFALLPWQAPVLAAAGAAVTAAWLLQPNLPAWLPAALVLAAVLPALSRPRPWHFAVLPPILAVAGGGWWALAGWSLAGVLVAGLVTLLPRLRTPAERVSEAEAHLAAHERGVMLRHLQRYPRLMEACLQLSQAREEDDLATTLLAAARALCPGWRGGRVYLGPAAAPVLRANDPPGPASPSEVLDRLVAYSASEVRMLVRRIGDEVLLCLPLRGERRATEVQDGQQRRGVLLVRMTSCGAEDVLVIDLLRALARLGGLGMAAVDLVDEARSLALHDDLTGLYGRHEFFRRTEEHLAAARREERTVGLIMLDLDHLKHFNDTYGHAAGDQALRGVARAIRDCLPANAAACRYGGEEFGVLVPPEIAERTPLVAETILDAIRQTRVVPEQPEVRLSASVGWAVVKGDETVDAAVARADGACYRAKERGRDRVEAGG